MNNASDILSELKDCVHNLFEVARRDATNTSLLQKYLLKLSQAFEENQNDNELLEQIGNILSQDGFLESFSSVWKTMHKSQESVYTTLPNTKEALLMQMKEILWNYTDRSRILCKQITNKKVVIDILMKELSSEQLAVDKMNQDHKRRHVKANFGILHNVVRHEVDAAKLIRSFNGIRIILRFKDSEFYIIQAYVSILMAYCGRASEIDAEALKFMKDELMKVAMKSENHIHDQYLFSVHELTEAICKMAVEDDNKKLVVDAGYLHLLEKILDISQFSNEEIQSSLQTLFNLASNAYCRKKIGETSIIAKLKSLKSSSTCAEDIRNQCDRLINNIETQKHIMISYQWDCQDIMIQVKEYLEMQGFSVWMDIEHMHGSLLSAMAQAVQKSSIVIAAISSKYQASTPCKREASYAHERNVKILPVIVEKGYKPEDWLGILIADTLYIDLSLGDPKNNFPAILKQLKLLGIYP